MKRTLVLLIVITNFQFVQSQDSLLLNGQSRYQTTPGKPIMVVSGEEIRRYPSANFLDAINGFFPWVFSQNPNSNDYLFIVDGFITADVNGISLNDIEEITFTRNNLNGSNFPYSRPGTFYIRTKTVNSRKPVIEFNSQYNARFNSRSRIFYRDDNGMQTGLQTLINDNNNKPGHFIGNHLSLATGTDKLRFYSGLQWNVDKDPRLFQDAVYGDSFKDSSTGKSTSTGHDIRAFANFEYKISNSVQMGLTGNYFTGRNEENSTVVSRNFNSVYSSEVSNPAKINYAHIGAFINWQPIQGLKNRLFFDYTDQHMNYDGNFKGTNAPVNVPTISWNSDQKNRSGLTSYAIRDELNYDFQMKGRFKAGVGALFSYTHDKISQRSTYIYETSGQLPSYGENFAKFTNKLTVLNPQFYFSIDSIVTGYAGYGFYLNDGISRYNSRSKANPYAGAMVDLKKAFAIKNNFSRLELGVHYGDLKKNHSQSYWLPELSSPGSFYPSPGIASIWFSTSPIAVANEELSRTILKNRMTSISLQAGFKEDRILVGIDWTSVKSQNIYIIQIATPFPDPAYVAVLGEQQQNGISGFVSTNLIKKQGFEWNTRFNLLVPKVKNKLKDIQGGNDMIAQNEIGPQAGWQNRFQFQKVYVQLNAIMGLDREYYTIPNFTPGGMSEKKKLDEISLNYLMVRYDLNVARHSFLDKLSVFVQGRNLVGSKKMVQYYQDDRYVGAGVNIRFK